MSGMRLLSDSVVILIDGFFCVVAVLAPQRRFRPGWPPSVSLFPACTPLVAETTEIFLLNDLGIELCMEKIRKRERHPTERGEKVKSGNLSINAKDTQRQREKERERQRH